MSCYSRFITANMLNLIDCSLKKNNNNIIFYVTMLICQPDKWTPLTYCSLDKLIEQFSKWHSMNSSFGCLIHSFDWHLEFWCEAIPLQKHWSHYGVSLDPISWGLKTACNYYGVVSISISMQLVIGTFTLLIWRIEIINDEIMATL